MRGIRRIPCGNVNCYLVQGEEGAVLVDTGYTGYVERLLDTCLGAGVRLIVLTHGHLDHIQNTALLMERLGVPAALPSGGSGPAHRSAISAPVRPGTGGPAPAVSLPSQLPDPGVPPFYTHSGAAGRGQPGPWGVDAGFWSCPAIRRAPSAWTWRGTPSLWGTP